MRTLYQEYRQKVGSFDEETETQIAQSQTGKGVQGPSDREAALLAEISATRRKLRLAEAEEASSAGGFIGGLASMKCAVVRQTLTLMEERLKRIQLGLPEAIAIPTASVAVAKPPGTVEISDIAGKWKDCSGDWWEMSWRFRARSTFAVQIGVYYEIKFLDEQGFQVGYCNGNLDLAPGTPRTVTGSWTEPREHAATVSRIEVEWRG